MLKEGNQIYLVPVPEPTLITYGSGSDFSTRYGSGSTSQKVTVPTVPVPQRCLNQQPFNWGEQIRHVRYFSSILFG